MAEGQVLRDAIDVGRSEHFRISQRPPPLGVLALEQMPPSRASELHLAGAGDLETFGHCLPCFNAFGASHTVLLSLEGAEMISAPGIDRGILGKGLG